MVGFSTAEGEIVMCYGDRNCAVRHLVKEDGLTITEAQAAIDQAIDRIEAGIYTSHEALSSLGLDSRFLAALSDWP